MFRLPGTIHFPHGWDLRLIRKGIDMKKCRCKFPATAVVDRIGWCQNCGGAVNPRSLWRRWLPFFVGAMFGATAVMVAIAMTFVGCTPFEPAVEKQVALYPPPVNVCDTASVWDPHNITVTGSRMIFELCDAELIHVEIVFTDRCVRPTIIATITPDVIGTGNPSVYSIDIPAGAGSMTVITIGPLDIDYSMFACRWERP